MSQRRAAGRSSRDFVVARAEVRSRDLGMCVRCGEPGHEVHHRRPRGMGGASRAADAHALPRLVLLCRACHRWVEDHRAEARAEGLLVSHGVAVLEGAPLLYRGRWVVLADDGRVLPLNPPDIHSSTEGGDPNA